MLHAFWTQGSYEAADDEKVVYSSSADGGKTWTEPVMIAGSPSIEDPQPVAAWQQPMISRSGRLYCLWNQETTVKKHLCGLMFGRYSDDGGKTWSKPEQVPFPIRFKADPEDPSVPPTWCMWQRPLRLGKDGRYIAGCSRYGSDGISKVEFWQYENIDDDPEIKNIRISFFNTDEDAFDAGKVTNDHDYSPRDGHRVEEACLIGLPDGRLFAVMRTTIGHPIWSVSSDDGETWSRPEILRMRDDGEPILQPCSPCPIYDYEGPEARSGKYFLMVHNTFDFNGLTSYQNRGPVYKLDGEFVPGAHQPVWFKEAGIFSPRDSGNSLYTSYTVFDREGVLWFGDQKYYLFGKKMR
ncbi:MAG: exo-alpha-sialidase [Bacteroidales bacterium]|nr:exo-alpha-sialidase [Bacteroidales bacterium]